MKWDSGGLIEALHTVVVEIDEVNSRGACRAPPCAFAAGKLHRHRCDRRGLRRCGY
jgi:hypothetical protein